MNVNVATTEDSLKSIISNAVPDARVRNLARMLSPGLHQIYRATIHDGTIILCSLPPSQNRRILRCEYASIRSEAAVLHWLSGLCERKLDSSFPNSAAADFEVKRERRNSSRAKIVSNYCPRLLEHGFALMFHQTPYNITLARPGVVISTLSSPLPTAERRVVDFQIGQMIRAMSLLQSPTSRFGNAASIVPPAPETWNWAQHRTSIRSSSETFTKWSDAFGDMLNSAIQDAQANQITASYDSIRRLQRCFANILDAVVEPRFVLLDAGLDTNVLVSFTSNNEAQEVDSDKASEDASSSPDERNSPDDNVGSVGGTSTIMVTGVRECIKGVFGDPLISSVFSWRPSKYLLHGYGTRLADTLEDTNDVYESMAQNQRHVQVRLSLYRIYHALNAISVEYIRRDEGSDPRELEARKALVESIRELDLLEEHETAKRPRTPTEAASFKRART